MYMFTIFTWLNGSLSYFKQLPLSFTLTLLPEKISFGASVLSGSLMISLDNPLDFHSQIISVLPVFLKYLYIG